MYGLSCSRCLLPVIVVAALLVVAPPAASGWSPTGSVVCTAASYQDHPTSTSDGEGGSFVAWTDGRNGTSDIYLQRMNRIGNVAAGWPANGVAVCTGAGTQSSPVIVSDGAGGAIVAWTDYRTGSLELYAQRITRQHTVAPGWPADGTNITTTPGPHSFPNYGDRRALIVSDNLGGFYVAWAEGDPNQSDIYCQRMTGAGQVAPGWPAGGRLVCNADNEQVWPRIAGDRFNGVLIAWEDARDEGDGGQPLDIFIQRITAAGGVYPGWPVNGLQVVNNPWLSQGYIILADIVADGADGAFLTWTDNRYGPEVFVQRITGQGSVSPGWPLGGKAVSTDPGCSSPGALNVDTDTYGNVNIVWTCDYYSLFAQRLDGAGAVVGGWPSGGLNLGISYQEIGDGNHLQSLKDGSSIIAAGTSKVVKLTGNGAVASGWPQSGLDFTGGRGGSTYFTTYLDDNEGVLIAWAPQADDIYAQRVASDGTLAPNEPAWTPNGIAVQTNAGQAKRPITVSDGSGGTYVVSVAATSVYAQHVLATGFTDGNWPYNGIFLGGATDTHFVSAASDGLGGVVVSWEGAGVITVQRITSSGVLKYGGSSGVQIGGGRFPATVSDGIGGCITSWTQFGEIRAQHLNGDGGVVPGWLGNGLVVMSPVNTVARSVAARDGSGGAIIGFTVQGGSDVRAQRVTSSGTFPWGPTGVSVEPSGAEPAIVADQFGGAVIAYVRYDQVTGFDMYAKRLTSSGAPAGGWPPDGLLVCNASGNQEYPQLVVDYEGGAYVSWQDFRNDPLAPANWLSDIYAQRVTGAGAIAVGWPSNGLAICDAAGDQRYFGLATDALGGAVFTWQDARSTPNCIFYDCEWDIYTRRVHKTGEFDPTFSANGTALVTLPGLQRMPSAAFVSGGNVVTAWEDGRDEPGCNNCNNRIEAQRVSFDGAAPAKASTLNASAPGCEDIVVTWSAPGDDGTSGYAAAYDLRWATSAISSVALFYAATPIATGPPASPGTAESAMLHVGVCSQPRFFALRTRDEAFNWSLLAYTTSGTSTPCPPPGQWCDAKPGIGTDIPTEVEYLVSGHSNGVTTVSYGVPAGLAGKPLGMGVFDIAGRRVRTLARATATAGRFRIEWDQRSESGVRVASGIYFVRFELGTEARTRKVAIIR